MDPVSLVAGIAGGGIFGFIVAMTSGKKTAAELGEQLTQSKADLKKKNEQVRQLESGKQKLEKAEKDLKAKDGKLDEATKKLKELESASSKASEQAASHQSARQQAEGKAKQAQQQATEAQTRLTELEQQLGDLAVEKDDLAKKISRKDKELKQLRESGGDSGLEESVEIFSEVTGNLDGILKALADTQQQNAAVLADSNGIVVSAFGDVELKEGLAAASHLLAETSSRLVGMVPFEAVKTFQLSEESAVIAGRTFSISGERLCLATYGSSVPSPRVLDGAMANLAAALE